MSQVRLLEVGPRDGLQNEKKPLSVDDKFEFIKGLKQAGLERIEASSFVRPDKIPQLADSSELMKKLKSHYGSLTNFPCLVPNLVGLENATKVGVEEIAIFSATSDTFNQRNINATVDESLERLDRVADLANKNKLKIRGYISTVFGCPYEGKTSIKKLMQVCKRFLSWNVEEISLGDTTGVAHPAQVREILKVLKAEMDLKKIYLHFHDTRGLALTNIYASLEKDMMNFDCSAGGIGGCPYALGASGNVATEELVYLFESLGLKTGVDREKVIDVSEKMLQKLNCKSPSKYHQAHLALKK